MRTSDWFRAPDPRRNKMRQTGFSISSSNRATEQLDDQLRIHETGSRTRQRCRIPTFQLTEVVKEAPRTCKGGASNLPAAPEAPAASEALFCVSRRDATKQ